MKNRIERFIIGFFNGILPVVFAFAIGAFIILTIGESPLETYFIMLRQTLFTFTGFMKTLHFATPLLLTGIAIAVTFKANIFNMGVEGQLLCAGFVANIIGSSFAHLPPYLLIPFCVLSAIISAMIFALIPAILKAYYKVNEMVVTLMLNYAMFYALQFLAQGIFRDPKSGYVSTDIVANNAMFNRIGGTYITVFSFVTLIVFVIIIFVFYKSTLGFDITSIGNNSEFAEAVGVGVRKKIIILMLISGAISGLAGSGYMLSEKFKFTLDFSGSPGLGWDGMLVSLLGAHSPLGILIAAIFYSALKTGADSIGIFTDVPKEIVSIIQGFIILFLSIRFIKSNKIFTKLFKNKCSKKMEQYINDNSH